MIGPADGWRLAAIEGIWPLVVLWVLWLLFARRKPQQGSRVATRPPSGRGQPATLADAFREALEELKRAESEASRPAKRPARPVTRPAMPLADDDADQSAETVPVPVTDYDEESVRTAQERRRAAEQWQETGPDAAARQAAAAPAHQAESPKPPGPRRGALARYANGSLRGALVLSEILRPPAGTR